MKVSILAHTPNPEELVASCAKLCYSSSGVSDLLEKQKEEDTEKFLNILIGMGHESPVEHISFTFGIEGVSRSLTHQLVRHRIASYSQQSQRYVKEDYFDFIIPPQIAKNEEARSVFVKHMIASQETYDEIVLLLTEEYMKEELGKRENKEIPKRVLNDIEKRAIEDARYVFPNACETKIAVTMNARTLLKFFNVRCCNRAQWEIRALADEMLRQVYDIAPSIFKHAGPPCSFSKCNEGSMSCGKVRKLEDILDK